VGRALIARIEGALAGLGAGDVVLAGNPPYYAWPGIDVRYTPAICAAMALGFEQDQPAWNMTASLDRLRPTDEAEKRLAEVRCRSIPTSSERASSGSSSCIANSFEHRSGPAPKGRPASVSGLRSPCLRHPEHRPGPGSSPACPPRPPRS
jgi:hypothetical protein